MKVLRATALVIGVASSLAGGYVLIDNRNTRSSYSATEAGFASERADEAGLVDPFITAYANWTRPAGPPRVALQVGHWKAAEAPEELKNIRGNGATGGGKQEWQVALAIAQEAKPLLEAQGIAVDVLPATIPPDYWADVLVSIHADGNPNPTLSGYKIAAPRRDMTKSAGALAAAIEHAYGEVTGLQLDPNVSDNMRGYYAFNWRRYEHAMHPMTSAAIVETGFLTSPKDRSIIVRKPMLAARGIADGIVHHLEGVGLLVPDDLAWEAGLTE